MGILSKNFLSNFLDKFMQRLNLSAKKLLKWYTVVLFFAPLLYAALLKLTVLKENQSIATMMAKQPLAAVSVIIAIVDFLIGYYCWMQQDQILADSKGYRTFMAWQMGCQLLLGNFICFILAALSIHAINKDKVETSSNKKSIININIVTLISTILLGGCVALVFLIGIRG